MDLFYLARFPLWVQPFSAFLASWGLLYLVQRKIPAFRHRRLVTECSFTAFAFYWLAFCLGLPLGDCNPYFGPFGLGDDVSFLLVMLLAYNSFRDAEHDVYWKAAFSKRFWVTFTKDGPKLERFPSLAQRSAEAEGKPFVPPGVSS